MLARLRATAARMILLAADRLAHRLGFGYQPRHAIPKTGYSFVDYHKRALLTCANSGHTLAVDYLLAIGFPEAKRYASAFGREVAKQYRINHGTEPHNGCLVVVRGRVQRCFGYEDAADLYAGADAYARTRKFLAAQRAEALHALAA